MPRSARPDLVFAFLTIEFRRALDCGRACRLAGAVVAAESHAAATAPHRLSATAPAAGAAQRRTDPRPYALVAAASAHHRRRLADRGPGRSAAGPGAETVRQWAAGAGDRQWLERRQRLGRTPERDRRIAARPSRGRRHGRLRARESRARSRRLLSTGDECSRFPVDRRPGAIFPGPPRTTRSWHRRWAAKAPERQVEP